MLVRGIRAKVSIVKYYYMKSHRFVLKCRALMSTQPFRIIRLHCIHKFICN